jgi:hypothetical protein
MRRVKLGPSNAAELYRSKPLVPQSILSHGLPNTVYQVFYAGVGPALYATSLEREASLVVSRRTNFLPCVHARWHIADMTLSTCAH